MVHRRRLTIFFLGILCGIAQARASAQVNPDRWRWSNPLPHGNNVQDMLVTSNAVVQVGDGGAVHVRGDDFRWVPATSGVTNYLRGVATMGSRLLVAGENGCIIWSDDGKEFGSAQLDPATSDWFEGVAASTQASVAVGDYGTVYFSANGIDWNRVASGTAEWLRGVARGHDGFVAVGENGTLLQSGNGTEWSEVDSGTSRHLNRVRYLGTGDDARYIAVGDGGIALGSPSGLGPWSLLPTGTTNNLYDVARNDEGLLLVGDQEILFQRHGESSWTSQIDEANAESAPAWIYLSAGGESTNWVVAGRTGKLVEGSDNGTAIAWSSFSNSSRAWIWDLWVQNGICVAVGDLAGIQTSLDGILWARESVPLAPTNTVILGVGGTSNLLVAVGNEGKVLASRAGAVSVSVTNEIDGQLVVTNLLVEAMGVVWTNVPAFTEYDLQGVAGSDGLFLVCGENGSVYSSVDGVAWVARPTPVGSFLSSVAIGPDGCAAVGSNGTVLRAGSDGTGWQAVPMGTSDWIYRVRWLEGRFVAVGQNGGIYSSLDGTAWNKHSSGTGRWLTDVAKVGDLWFACGYQGTLLASPDLENWSRLPLPTVKSLFSMANMDGRLLVAGIEGVILRNQVVPIDSPVDFLDYSATMVDEADSSSTLYQVFLVGGVQDQVFELQASTNLVDGVWDGLGGFELYDSAGTLFLIRSQPVSDVPQSETYRTLLVP